MLPRHTGLAIAALSILAGCAPVDSEVAYVSPASAELATATDLVIEVGFDRAMDPATILDSSFVVEGSESGVHEGAFVFLVQTSIVQFFSTTGYVAGETVTVQLTDTIESMSDKKLDPYRWSFEIDAGPTVETGPFHLVSLTPPIESNDAPRVGTVEITLASPYSPFSVGDGSVRIDGSRSGQRELSFADLFTGGDTLRVNVDRSFLAGERVTVTVTPLLRSLEGAHAPDSVAQFTVGNRGSLWPTTTLDSGTGLVDGQVLCFDPDADGFEEWAVVGSDGSISVRDIDGDGPGALFTWDLGTAVAGAAVGDFDGDGHPDLVLLGASGNTLHLLPGSASLALLLDPPVAIPLARPATGLAPGHADTDGIADLVLHDDTGATVAWGDTTEPLANAQILPALAPVAPAAIGDYDGDALPDLAFAIESGDVVVLRGLETRDYEVAVTLTPAEPAVGVFSASLNGDDIADLVAISEAGVNPTAFLAAGSLQFDPLALYIGAAGRGTVAVDWDGDGVCDLLTPVVGGIGATLALGVGDGNFESPVTEGTQADLVRISVGDVDGDGTLDLALVSSDGSWEVAPSEPAVPQITDRILVDDLTAGAGESGVTFTVRADHDLSIEGYTIVLGFDPAVVTIETIGTVATDAAVVGAEFEIPSIDTVNGVAILAVILDFLPPYDGQTLIPATGDSIATGTLSVAAGATGSTELAPTDGLGSPPSDNTFVSGGTSIAAEGIAGTLTIGSVPPSGPTFLRGDANRDGLLDISDGTYLQSYLVGSGPTPSCFDAADVNDDGRVDLGDAVYLYNFIFQGASAPPPPYPLTGSDPTTDLLDCVM